MFEIDPAYACCHTCMFFRTDMTLGDGTPACFIGECRHPDRDNCLKEGDDCCNLHEYATWTNKKLEVEDD